jgi:hypothetical protein
MWFFTDGFEEGLPRKIRSCNEEMKYVRGIQKFLCDSSFDAPLPLIDLTTQTL